jgi:sugar phosphate isomerase/epimerase
MKTGKMENGVEVYSAEIFTELGQGIIDVKSVFDILKSVHYDGYLCVELDRSRFDNKESAAMNMQFLKDNW